MRTSARFLLRSLDLRAWSFLLALLSVIVGVSVAATAFDLKADIGKKLSRELRSYGPNLLVFPAESERGRDASSERADATSRERAGGALRKPRGAALPAAIGEAQEREVRRIAGSAACVPILYAAGRAWPRKAARAGAVGTGVAVAGIPFGLEDSRLLFAYWRIDGSWPRDGGEASRAPGVARTEEPAPCLLGSRLARILGLLKGDPLRMDLGASREMQLEVVGTVATGEAEEEEVFVPLERLRRAEGGAAGASVLALRVDGGPEGVERTARGIQAASLGLQARPLRQVAQAEGQLLGRLDLMLALLGGLILLLSGLCVMTTLISLVVEREPEIGLMRSLGAGDGEIVRMLLGEATLLGLFGGLLGFALGLLNASLLGARLFGAAIAPRPQVLPVVLAIAVGLCWLSVLVPLRRALRIRPAVALRGE